MPQSLTTVSFAGAELMTPVFFNASIGRLYGTFEYDYVDARLSISDVSEEDKKLVPIMIKRAKRYYQNPEFYDKFWKQCIEEW